LKTNTTLDKTKIGEYFGELIDFNKKVMHAFIDSLNLKKMPFVSAMRTMLMGFRLPGESQKIDRILMKFGEKFFKDNPTAFVSAMLPTSCPMQ